MWDYVIPGNDDAIRAIQLYVHAAAEAIQEGKAAANIVKQDEFIEIESEQQTAKPKPAASKTVIVKKAAINSTKEITIDSEAAVEASAEKKVDTDAAIEVDGATERWWCNG